MFLDLDGLSIFCPVTGNGPPLVALHGNGEDHHIFDPLLPHLAGQFTLYTPDSRCHGHSGHTPAIGYDALRGDLLALLDALGLERVSLLGFSDGAIVSLLLAMDQPRRVERMALLGVNLSPEDFHPPLLEELREEFARTGDPLLRLMLEEPRIPLESLEAVSTPTLLVAGEEDLFPQSLYRQMEAVMPCARFVPLPGSGHDDYLADPPRLLPHLWDFFSIS